MRLCFYSSAFILFLFSAQVMAQTCVQMFPELSKPQIIASESNRLQITQTADGESNSKLIVSQEEFSKNVNHSVLEMVRMVVRNSDFKLEDKNVLIKNKFTLGIPIRDGYSLLLTYESKSERAPRFVLQDKIILVTPTGKEFKISEDLIDNDQLKINKAEFDLKDYIPHGLELKLKVPLVVEGKLLTAFAKLANFFEYFEKEKIRQIFLSDNLLWIKAQFQVGRAKKVFFDVLTKEPFKFFIGGGMMYLVFGPNFINPQPIQTAPLYTPPAITQIMITNTINGLPIPKADKQLRQDIEEIKLQAQKISSTPANSHLGLADLDTGTKKIAIKPDALFVMDKLNEQTGLRHTYLVFSEEIVGQRGPGLQYFVLEINPTKYQRLISFIKNQDLQPPVDAAHLNPQHKKKVEIIK